MDNRKKALWDQIRVLLWGSAPDQTVIFFDGKYILGESLKNVNTQKEITQVQAKVILNENPDCKAYCIYLSHNEPPESITDDLERYEWIRANPIEPDIPPEIADRINPPEGIIIGVTSQRCAESLVNLFSGIKDRPNPTHSKEY